MAARVRKVGAVYDVAVVIMTRLSYVVVIMTAVVLSYLAYRALSKRPPRIPDPGQHVDLRAEDGLWRKGFRAISEPWTAQTGEVVISVATEDEYRVAGREGRSAVGVPWPTGRMRLASPRLPWQLSYPSDTWAGSNGSRFAWRRAFGG